VTTVEAVVLGLVVALITATVGFRGSMSPKTGLALTALAALALTLMVLRQKGLL